MRPRANDSTRGRLRLADGRQVEERDLSHLLAKVQKEDIPTDSSVKGREHLEHSKL